MPKCIVHDFGLGFSCLGCGVSMRQVQMERKMPIPEFVNTEKAQKDFPDVDGFSVYKWPEFKAFMDRLGFAWDRKTLDITILIPLEGLVKITHEYYGAGTNSVDEEE